MPPVPPSFPHDRLTLENPWWRGAGDPDAVLPRRDLFERLFRTVHDGTGVIRLAGPRRVGKSVLIRQLILRLLQTGLPPDAVAVIPWDAPALSGVPLERLWSALPLAGREGWRLLVLDGCQHRSTAQAEAAALAAAEPGLCLVTVSALGGAAGADLVLPPLRFCEYLRLTGAEDDLVEPVFLGRSGRPGMFAVRDMAGLNRRFADYLAGGGFPEAVLLRQGGDGGRILRDRVIDALLHHDLPALCGLGDSAGLTDLFVRLAHASGRELTIEGLSEETGLAKNTVRRYLDHLESAFLITRMGRVHPAGDRFRRMRSFKLHLTAPCLHAALFGPSPPDSPAFAALAEGAIVGQWLGSAERERLVFCRLAQGTVDLVGLSAEDDRPVWACAVPGNDDSVGDQNWISGLIQFSRLNPGLRWLGATTRSIAALRSHILEDGRKVEVWHRPAAQYGYEVGRRIASEG